MIFRPTRKLAGKIKVDDLPEQALDDNPHGDWSAKLFTFDRRQYILLVHTRALLATVMPGAGISTAAAFTDAALENIHRLLKGMGSEAVFTSHVQPAAEQVTFARTLNRSVTGTMNEMTYSTELFLARRDDPQTIAALLNRTPWRALGQGRSDMGYPIDVFSQLRRDQP